MKNVLKRLLLLILYPFAPVFFILSLCIAPVWWILFGNLSVLDLGTDYTKLLRNFGKDAV